MATLSPPSSADVPCLVFLMLLDGSERDCGWDLVLSGPKVGTKCSCRLTWSPVDFKGKRCLLLFLVDSMLTLGCWKAAPLK